ncbi:GALM-like protein [Mya arenaria]|uniref:Galactose mutarotase n=1 Tax=Mya arenaria TaxID=6604 RepID=A0ABY7FEL7_MYAAR|nr:GALM-like protein [Mya arenaria]
MLACSDVLDDLWEIRYFETECYLSKKTIINVNRNKFQSESESRNEVLQEDTSLSNDEATEMYNNTDCQILSVEYHVLYSESYSVPVLYFNCHLPDGRLLTLNEIWSQVPLNYQERLQQDRWTFLTQVEHPYLGRPFYQLHPCHTDKLMAMVAKVPGGVARNYVISWLSSVGPVVGLNLRPEYGIPEKMAVTKEKYATTADGKDINVYTLRNGRQSEVRLIDWGAIITHIRVPDKNGQIDDITLGYDTFKDGYDTNPFYFGGIIGRYTNRIARGEFRLDDQTYNLTVNNGGNLLHGGNRGFDKRLWESEITQDGVMMRYTSADGEEGFPGEARVNVHFRLTAENELVIDFKATCTKPTVINLTSHPYFNLAGHAAGSLEGHTIRMDAENYTPLNENSIPTGEIARVKGTAFDLTTDTDFAQRLPAVPGNVGFDHNFVVYHAGTGRQMDVYSTEPGVQVYTAYYVDAPKGKGGAKYGQWSGFCLEAQHYPDSPNNPTFPSTTVRPGETYKQTTKYAFSVIR